MIPINYLHKETGIELPELFDMVYGSEANTEIADATLRLLSEDQTDFVERLIPTLRGYQIPNHVFEYDGMPATRLSHILSGARALCLSDKEFIEDVLRYNIDCSGRTFKPEKYFSYRLEEGVSIDDNIIARCKSPDNCEAVIKVCGLVDKVKHVRADYKSGPVLSHDGYDSHSRYELRRRRKGIDWKLVYNKCHIRNASKNYYFNADQMHKMADAVDVLYGNEEEYQKYHTWWRACRSVLPNLTPYLGISVDLAQKYASGDSLPLIDMQRKILSLIYGE